MKNAKKCFLTQGSAYCETPHIQKKRKDVSLLGKQGGSEYYSLFLLPERREFGLYRLGISIKKNYTYTMKKSLRIPKLKNENRERDFWAKVNLADYFEPSDFEKASFPNLRSTSHAISLRIPDHILARLKERANEINVPYQSLMKEYIAEGIVRDRSDIVYKAQTHKST